jgi:primosomal protein N''
VTDNASAHFEQLRFEKEVQKQEYETNLAELIAEKEDLQKKANDCWEEQNDAKEA